MNVVLAVLLRASLCVCAARTVTVQRRLLHRTLLVLAGATQSQEVMCFWRVLDEVGCDVVQCCTHHGRVSHGFGQGYLFVENTVYYLLCTLYGSSTEV